MTSKAEHWLRKKHPNVVANCNNCSQVEQQAGMSDLHRITTIAATGRCKIQPTGKSIWASRRRLSMALPAKDGNLKRSKISDHLGGTLHHIEQINDISSFGCLASYRRAIQNKQL